MVGKNRAVVCLLATSAIILSEKKKRKRKTWSKKWYLKRNISCDADLLNELLETDVPWDDAIVVWAGKLGKLWDSVSELRGCVCERRLERTVLRPALLPVKTAQSTLLPSGIMSNSKIAGFLTLYRAFYVQICLPWLRTVWHHLNAAKRLLKQLCVCPSVRTQYLWSAGHIFMKRDTGEIQCSSHMHFHLNSTPNSFNCHCKCISACVSTRMGVRIPFLPARRHSSYQYGL